MKALFLIRHAQSEFNEKGIFQGKLDSDLTPLGFVQARLVANSLREEDLDMVITSPQRRAYKTAQTISDVLGIPLIEDERIREMSFGELEGKEFIRVAQEYGDTISLWLTDPVKNPLPTQEPMESFRERIEDFLSELMSKREKNLAVVAHGGSLQALVCLATGLGLSNMWKVHMDNTGISLLRQKEGSRFEIVFLNRTCHLKALR